MTKDTYDIVGDAVREFWHKLYPTDAVVFFWQKYEHSDAWEWCEELVECHSDTDYENMTFLYDFCEGQTEVQIVAIVPLRTLTEFYSREYKLKERERKND